MKKLVSICFLLFAAADLCATSGMHSALSGDTTYIIRERYMLFNDGYMRTVKKLYIDGKLHKKTITVDCMICTYRYTVRRREREYN